MTRVVDPEKGGLETRVLVLTALPADGDAICEILSRAGFGTVWCDDMADLCRKMEEGAGAAILTSLALAGDALAPLSAALAEQPPWSNFPIILLTGGHGGGTDVWRMLDKLKATGFVLLMERPLHTAALISAVRSMLGSRLRQYQVRDLLEERQRLIDAVPVLLGYIDREQRYRFVNRACVEALGIPHEQLVGRHLRDVLGKTQYQDVLPHIERALAGAIVEYETVLTFPGRSPRTLLVRLVPEAGGLFFSATDITEARQAATVRLLSAGLIRGQEEERRRIARELHDDFVQRTAFLAIELDKVSAGSEKLDRALAPAKEHLVLLSDDMRNLSHQLHPSILDDLGLESAIRHECESMEGLDGLRIEFESDDGAEGLPPDIQLCLYRIVQESLHNVRKHARASRVTVHLERNAGEIRLSIEDNGVGFDPRDATARRGIGLAAMRERVRPFEGRLRLETRRGSGTRIEAAIPVSESTVGEPGSRIEHS